MIERHDLEKLFLNVIEEFNAQSDEGCQLTSGKEEKLFGDGGLLDSIGLVTLITIIEEHLEDTLDISITIADDKAMSRKNSPFRTVGSLLEYVIELIREHQNG